MVRSLGLCQALLLTDSQELANGKITWHVLSASWQKNSKVIKGHETDKQLDHRNTFNKSLP